MKRAVRVLAGLVLMAGAMGHLRAGPIINGSFESPGISGTSGFGPGREQYSAPSVALTGWIVAGNGDIFLHKSPDIGNSIDQSFNFAQNGNFYLDLSGSYQNSAHALVYQDFATTPGSKYELTFYIGASAQQPVAPTINVQLTGATTLLDNTLTPLAPSTNINWSLQEFSFVANSATTRLGFQDVSTSDDNTSFVDNVSVNPAESGPAAVPEPSSLALLGMATATFAGYCRWRRRIAST